MDEHGELETANQHDRKSKSRITIRQAFLVGVGVTLGLIMATLAYLSSEGQRLTLINQDYLDSIHHPPMTAHSIPSYAPSGHHPSIDCKSYAGEVEPAKGSQKISELSRDLEGSSVKVRAFVVGAFYSIMDTNWYQLCDIARGSVLVVQSDARIARNQIVTVSGKLTFDQQIARAYNFERLIVDGTFPNAKKLRRPPPEGITEL